ncbi:MAG TPA: dihydroneopterin triphosphate diphosphatase [Gammaproteobacteria bacterium]|nr:dihydroneopterin triphosphate diphosphatase [Gammaproteobacteria bacterium]
MPFKRPESVLVLITALNGKVLLLQRKDKPDFWQSVTGSLEWDEQPAEAARRELFEETGLADQPVKNNHFSQSYTIFPSWRFRYAPGVRRNREHLFTVTLEKMCPIIISDSEHLHYEWLDWPEAAEKVTSWSNREAIFNHFDPPRLLQK